MKNKIFFLALASLILSFQAQAQAHSPNIFATSSRLEILSISEEWNTVEDSTIVFVWCSDSPIQGFSYRTKSGSWTSLKPHQTRRGWYAISFSKTYLTDDTNEIYFRICSGKANGIEDSIEGTVRVVIPEKYPPYF